MNIEAALTLAKALAVEAGELIMRHYKTDIVIDIKSNDTPVTLADLESNNLIVAGLQGAFPEAAILSEESADDLARLDAEYCWIIDPLDGTKEFIKQNDEFAVNIALAQRGKILLGVIYAPVFKELYYATLGGGAFLETFTDAGQSCKPLKVSERRCGLRVLKSRSNDNPTYVRLIEAQSEQIAHIQPTGSSYKGCLIASGDFDIYYSFGTTSIWDIAPLEVIVTEAGGYFAQADYTPFYYNERHTLNPKGFVILNHYDNKFD